MPGKGKEFSMPQNIRSGLKLGGNGRGWTELQQREWKVWSRNNGEQLGKKERMEGGGRTTRGERYSCEKENGNFTSNRGGHEVICQVVREVKGKVQRGR